MEKRSLSRNRKWIGSTMLWCTQFSRWHNTVLPKDHPRFKWRCNLKSILHYMDKIRPMHLNMDYFHPHLPDPQRGSRLSYQLRIVVSPQRELYWSMCIQRDDTKIAILWIHQEGGPKYLWLSFWTKVNCWLRRNDQLQDFWERRRHWSP